MLNKMLFNDVHDDYLREESLLGLLEPAEWLRTDRSVFGPYARRP